MEALVQEFTEYLCVELRHSPHTVDGYRRDIKRFVSFRSGVPLKSITPADIREFLLSLHQKGLSSRSVARALSSLKSFFKYLVEEGLIVENPVETLETPKIWRKLPNTLSLNEVELILNQPDWETPLGHRDKTMLDRAQIRSPFQQVGGKSMPQGMRRRRNRNAGFSDILLQNLPEGLPGHRTL